MLKKIQFFANIKLIAKKIKEQSKIAGIHNGTIQYAKEMIEIGYKFITISSDFRAMTTYAQGVVNEMKQLKTKTSQTNTY